MSAETIAADPLAMHHFIDRYIVTRAHALSDATRLAVKAGIERYPGRFPTSRLRLERFLDRYLGLVALPSDEPVPLRYAAASAGNDND